MGQTSEGVPCLWPMHRMGALASSTTAQRGGGTADVRSGVTSSLLPSTTAAVPYWLVLLCRAILTCERTLETSCSWNSQASLNRQFDTGLPTALASCIFLWPLCFPSPYFDVIGHQAYLRAESVTCDGGQAQPYFLPGREHFTRAQAANLPLQVPVPIGPLPDLDTAAVCNRSIPSLHTSVSQSGLLAYSKGATEKSCCRQELFKGLVMRATSGTGCEVLTGVRMATASSWESGDHDIPEHTPAW